MRQVATTGAGTRLGITPVSVGMILGTIIGIGMTLGTIVVTMVGMAVGTTDGMVLAITPSIAVGMAHGTMTVFTTMEVAT